MGSAANERAAPWARATKNVKKPQDQMCELSRSLDFCLTKKQIILGSVTHMILVFVIVKNEC